jgi:hypothetical protein
LGKLGKDELPPLRGQSGQVAHGSLGLQSPAHAPAIVPHGRRGQTVNGMADQTADQGRSESRVSRSEVVCPRGIRVSFGPILPYSARLTSVVEKMVDGGAEGEVRSARG